MFYLTTHSTHFVYGHMAMVKGSLGKKKKAAISTWATIRISSKGSFICTILTDRIAHITAFVIPVVEHWLKQRNV